MEYLTYLLPVGIGGIVAVIAWAALGQIGTKTTAAKETAAEVPTDSSEVLATYSEQAECKRYATLLEALLRKNGDVADADAVKAMIPKLSPFGGIPAEAAT